MSAAPGAAVARLEARESAPAYAALGALAGAAAVAAAWAARGDHLGAAARARLAAGYAAGAAEVLVFAAAALAVALTLPRDIATGQAATVLVRPIGRGAFLAARFAGALGAAAAALLAALAALAIGIAAAGGSGALAALAPRALVPPELVETPEGPAPAPLGLSTGEEARFWFAARDAADADRIRIAAAFAFVSGTYSPVAVRVRLGTRGASGDAGGGADVLAPAASPPPIDLGRIELPPRRPVELPVPAALARARGPVAVALTVETPDAHVRFGAFPLTVALASPPRSLALAAGQAALAMLVEAAFVAALATLAATLLSGWPAALFALGLGLAARTPHLLRAAEHGAAFATPAPEGGGAAPPGSAGGGDLAAAVASRWLGAALRQAGDALARALPDLSKLDLAEPTVAGRTASLAAPGGRAALAVVLVWIAAALALAWLAFRRAEAPGRGGAP